MQNTWWLWQNFFMQSYHRNWLALLRGWIKTMVQKSSISENTSFTFSLLRHDSWKLFHLHIQLILKLPFLSHLNKHPCHTNYFITVANKGKRWCPTYFLVVRTRHAKHSRSQSSNQWTSLSALPCEKKHEEKPTTNNTTSITAGALTAAAPGVMSLLLPDFYIITIS